MTYYNENDAHCVQWLRNLIDAGLISKGVVDDRSIKDVSPDDLRGFNRCHFFAGIGCWDYALQLAGWPEGRPVWTGSAPCPPFSAAGKKKRCPECQGRVVPHPKQTGIFACIECAYEWLADERHLWPEMRRLVAGSKPPVAFGEQVGGADGRIWLSGVRVTLEEIGYDVGGADLAAASVGAPHIRQRLFWVANASGAGLQERGGERGVRPEEMGTYKREAIVACADNGFRFWDDYRIIACRDGKKRRVKSGIQPLVARHPFLMADGTPGHGSRAKALRGIGNAIVPQVAAVFVRAFLELE